MIMGAQDGDQLPALLREAVLAWDVVPDAASGLSKTHDEKKQIRAAIREAQYARVAAEIEGKNQLSFENIGQYQFLIPNIHSESVQGYMRDYLDPILEPEESELLKTIIQFTLAEGDVNQVAEQLFCHKNTVRYRINKLHQMLAPDAGDFLFYEQVVTAVKIYLADRYFSR